MSAANAAPPPSSPISSLPSSLSFAQRGKGTATGAATNGNGPIHEMSSSPLTPLGRQPPALDPDRPIPLQRQRRRRRRRALFVAVLLFFVQAKISLWHFGFFFALSFWSLTWQTSSMIQFQEKQQQQHHLQMPVQQQPPSWQRRQALVAPLDSSRQTGRKHPSDSNVLPSAGRASNATGTALVEEAESAHANAPLPKSTNTSLTSGTDRGSTIKSAGRRNRSNKKQMKNGRVFRRHQRPNSRDKKHTASAAATPTAVQADMRHNTSSESSNESNSSSSVNESVAVLIKPNNANNSVDANNSVETVVTAALSNRATVATDTTLAAVAVNAAATTTAHVSPLEITSLPLVQSRLDQGPAVAIPSAHNDSTSVDVVGGGNKRTDVDSDGDDQQDDDVMFVNCAAIATSFNALSALNDDSMAIRPPAAPLSLWQCVHLLHELGAVRAVTVIENGDLDVAATAAVADPDMVSIVPRTDLFPTLSMIKDPIDGSTGTVPAATPSAATAFAVSSMEPLGHLHFHFRALPDVSLVALAPSAPDATAAKNQRRNRRLRQKKSPVVVDYAISTLLPSLPNVPMLPPQELEWFSTTTIHHRHKAAYYSALGQTLGRAYHCVWNYTSNVSAPSSMTVSNETNELQPLSPSFACPSYQAPKDSSDQAPPTTTTSMSRTWTVPHSVLAPVLSSMYQLPTTTTTPSSALHTGAEALTMDQTLTPAVAIFHHVFAEVNTSRLLLRLPTSLNATTSSENATAKPHRQVLIQLNSCNVPEARNNATLYEPFAPALHITDATSIEQARQNGVVVFDGPIVLISALWSTDFYHGSVEHVPRLLLLRDFIERHPFIPVVVAKSHRGCILHDLAKQWGNLEHRMVRLGTDQIVYAPTMYIPEPTTCLALQPAMAQAYRNVIRQTLLEQPQKVPSSLVLQGSSANGTILPTEPLGFDAENVTLTSNTLGPAAAITDANTSMAIDSASASAAKNDNWIVVLRRRTKRFIRNHEGMMAALQAAYPNETWFVFDEQYLDQLPPGLPQWNVFDRAKMVIAPHGAGLSNLLACRPGTHVVEFLAHEKDFQLCFLHLALGLGLNYHPLHMDYPRPFKRKTWSYIVDVAHVVDVVGSILQSTTRAALPMANGTIGGIANH